jgi:hypothetical protein
MSTSGSITHARFYWRKEGRSTLWVLSWKRDGRRGQVEDLCKDYLLDLAESWEFVVMEGQPEKEPPATSPSGLYPARRIG